MSEPEIWVTSAIPVSLLSSRVPDLKIDRAIFKLKSIGREFYSQSVISMALDWSESRLTLFEDIAMDETALAYVGFSNHDEFEIVSFFADFPLNVLFVHL